MFKKGSQIRLEKIGCRRDSFAYEISRNRMNNEENDEMSGFFALLVVDIVICKVILKSVFFLSKYTSVMLTGKIRLRTVL